MNDCERLETLVLARTRIPMVLISLVEDADISHCGCDGNGAAGFQGRLDQRGDLGPVDRLYGFFIVKIGDMARLWGK